MKPAMLMVMQLFNDVKMMLAFYNYFPGSRSQSNPDIRQKCILANKFRALNTADNAINLNTFGRQ